MKLCRIENCSRRHLAKGYCEAHYQRLRDSGDPQADRPIGQKSGSYNPKWRGGESKMPDGRVLVYNPSYPGPKVAKTYVLRYRLVMEEKLGRFLRTNEIVHHINGIPWDDRPENLEVMTQSEHAAIHMKHRKRSNKGRMV